MPIRLLLSQIKEAIDDLLNLELISRVLFYVDMHIDNFTN